MKKMMMLLPLLLIPFLGFGAESNNLPPDTFSCVANLNATVSNFEKDQPDIVLDLQLSYDFNKGGKGHLTATGRIKKSTMENYIVSRNVYFNYLHVDGGEYELTITDVDSYKIDNYPNQDVGMYLSMGQKKNIIYIEKIWGGYLFFNAFAPVFLCVSRHGTLTGG
ncbi:hypothetical protein ACMV5I_28650 [Serratia sp. T13T92]|uniref:hypothetical protein n=1 Tax=Serratia sp. T13T92 TaxID=3397496 RepID=UPI0039E06970